MRSSLGRIAQHRGFARPSLPLSVRNFSMSRAAYAEDQNQASGRSARPPSSPRAPTRSPRPQPGARSARALDARSLAAPRTGGEGPKILRSPRTPATLAGKQNRFRKPGQAGRKNKPKGSERKPRRFRGAEEDEIYGADEKSPTQIAAEIDEIVRQQEAKGRPVPVRYEPGEIDFSTLKETWPGLPTDTNAQSVAVLEKLSALSGRFANGYVPPYELGRRLWRGQNVLFENEAEKAEAMAEVQRLAVLRADKMSQRKGDLVEPRKVEFKAIGAEVTKQLVETYAQGKYPTLEAGKDQPDVLGEVVRNLRNNGTYQTTGKRPQFLAKVESLLGASRVKSS